MWPDSLCRALSAGDSLQGNVSIARELSIFGGMCFAYTFYTTFHSFEDGSMDDIDRLSLHIVVFLRFQKARAVKGGLEHPYFACLK